MPISRTFLCVVALFAGAAAAQKSPAEWAKRLKYKDTADRLLAANELGKLGAAAASACAPLAAALGDDVAEVRNAAAAALGKIGKPAVAHVGRALADRDRHLGALRAAAELGPLASELMPAIAKCWLRETADTSDAIERCVVAIGEPAVPHLTECLKDVAINSGVCRALARLGPKARRAVPALLELLARRGIRAPEEAAAALGPIGDPAAVGPLVRTVDEALGKPANFFFDSIGEKAMGSLAQLKAEPQLVMPLALRVLASPRQDPPGITLKGRALTALERFDVRTPEVIAALRAFLAGQPGGNERDARRLLGKLGG